MAKQQQKGNPNWGRNAPIEWCFRIRGKNPDGKIVTLGKYKDKGEANSRYDELINGGHYRNLEVEAIEPTPADSGSKDS